MGKWKKRTENTFINEIQQMIKTQREMKCNSNASQIEYAELCKTIHIN